MFGLFRKRDAVINELLNRIAICKNEILDNTSTLFMPFLADQLLARLSNVIKHKWTTEHIKNYKKKIESGDTHDAFIYNYLVHSSADEMESGRHHVYRGVLAGDGNAYQAIFEYLTERGEYTKEWADKNLREPVYSGVKTVG